MRVVNSYAEVPHPNRGDDRGSRLTDYEVLGRNLLGDGVICAAPLEPASVRLTVAKKF
jgi:hypothetical protein